MAPLKQILIGRPISSADEHHQRLSKKIALPVFASDAISSTAYATDEILVVLLLQAGIGGAAFGPLVPIAIVVCVLMVIVVISYRQTIMAYPSGGGAYIVSRENLGTLPALVAGVVAAGRLHPDGVGQRGRRRAGHPHRDRLRHQVDRAGVPAVRVRDDGHEPARRQGVGGRVRRTDVLLHRDAGHPDRHRPVPDLRPARRADPRQHPQRGGHARSARAPSRWAC